MDARFELDRFPLFANEYGEGVVSGWVWLAGTTAAPVVEGSLTTNRFVLLVPEQLPGSVTQGGSGLRPVKRWVRRSTWQSAL